MFPVKRRDIGEGGNTPWSTDALPYNPIYCQALAAPKPDHHYRYPAGPKSDWSFEENAVVDHPKARPYTQPARGNRFSLPGDRVQVRSYRWELIPCGKPGDTQWYSLRQLNVMAPSRGLSFSNSSDDLVGRLHGLSHSQTSYIPHILLLGSGAALLHILFHELLAPTCCRRSKVPRHCEKHSRVGLGIRQAKIKDALAQLYPFPGHWKVSRPGSITSTPATSFTEGPRSTKSSRKE
ncbi:hypothetical protein MMC24_007350 [Lignoscripta atroalba]|nr:hypothetical protein [Lignoscripta atroalba]